MRRERSADALQDILDFIDRIERWTSPELPSASGSMDEKTLYAVLHALQYIGEAVSRLPDETTGMAPEIPWSRIKSMRNVIVHDYAGIDSDIVRKTIEQRLPELRAAVEKILRLLSRR